MGKKKVAPNRGKHSASRDTALPSASAAAENTALPSASAGAENTAPSSPKNTASSPYKNPAPALADNPASSPTKNMAPAPAKNTAPSSVKNTAPASSNEDGEALPPFKYDAAENTGCASAKNKAPVPAKNMASASSKHKAPVLAKNTASASSKNKAPVPAKNTASASAKNKTLAPAKNKRSASSENTMAVPAASDSDKVDAPPQDTTLSRFVNFLCEKATSRWWQGLLDAFLTWMHGSAGNDTSDASSISHTNGVEIPEQEENVVEDAEALTESSTDQEQGNQMYLEETKKTELQALPQLLEESRCQHHAYIYGKKAQHRNGRDRDVTEADQSVPAGPSTSQVDDSKFGRYLRSSIHKHYVKLMRSCQLRLGMVLCAVCYFEKNYHHPRPQSSMINHFGNNHGPSDGVRCKNCAAIFRFDHHLDLHGVHCNA